jgi:predicted transcriptional regulator
MPCIDSSGQLSDTAKKILSALANPSNLEALAQRTGLPLYQIRSAAREIMRAGLIEEKDGTYALTAAGRTALETQRG